MNKSGETEWKKRKGSRGRDTENQSEIEKMVSQCLSVCFCTSHS